MPSLHLTSASRPPEAGRARGRGLTAATPRAPVLPDADRARTTVQFAPVSPEDIATGGVLRADGTAPDYCLQVTDHGPTPGRGAALVRELLPALPGGLGQPPAPSSAFLVNIELDHDDPGAFAPGGVFLPALRARRGAAGGAGGAERERG